MWKNDIVTSVGFFYLEFSLEAAVSFSFDYFSILTEVLEIHFFTFFRLFLIDFCVKIYLEVSLEIFILILAWIFVY